MLIMFLFFFFKKIYEHVLLYNFDVKISKSFFYVIVHNISGFYIHR